MKIKKNDNVIILSGKDKGKKGKVLRSLPKDNRLIVEGVNIAKKRQKPRKVGQKGQVLNYSLPVDASNVLVVCSSCGKGVRIGYKMVADKKVRICKKCNREI